MAGKLELIRNVLLIRRYAAVAVASGAALGMSYYFLTMYLLPTHLGVMISMEPVHVMTAIGLTAAVSGLGGINIALIAYRIKRIRMAESVKSDSSAVLGGAFAAFTPGCPACTAPLAVVLGAVGGLSIFPMQGLELKLISVGALAFSIYWVARSMQKSSCCSIK